MCNLCMLISTDSLSKNRHLSNAQDLLHSAWLGDAVSVKKSLVCYNQLLHGQCGDYFLYYNYYSLVTKCLMLIVVTVMVSLHSY